jgi:hypothetical protein
MIDGLIEDNIMRYVDSLTNDIQTLKTFVKIVIAQEHTFLRVELEFVCIE